MIETNYFILENQDYQELEEIAAKLEITVDYYLLEFCNTQDYEFD
jgi:hypothetical protein